ncbi:RelA/SpoT domain-containing protein [Isoptericola aurantiacus]|uniref:RelA/SpoT domain-containing protein n=1 Tax=Isoptericola aurantiacus TaxID=3377839 RepID=UPI003839D439
MVLASELTPSRVNKAGKTIRRVLRGDAELDPDRFEQAVDILLAFRAAHQRPLTTANMGLRSMVRTERCAKAEVSQRLKRVPTILDKLVREPTLPLSRMQDLGGCRAVLSSIDEVYRVQSRIAKRRTIESVSDYIEEPRASGYRGVHVIAWYKDRRIEVQLRTQVMHQWAVTVEQLSAAIGKDVKSGYGPQEVQDLMQAISHAMAIEEQGGIVEDELLHEMRARREAAAPHLAGGER